MAREPAGLILDMDGVLADTEPLQARAWVVLLERYGVVLETGFFDRWIGIPNMETARDVAARWGLERAPEELIAEREPVYLDLVDVGLEPFPGLPALLHALEVPMAVATSGRRAEVSHVITRLGLERCFRALVTADDVARTKPDAEPYLRAAASLGLDPASCVAVEDSPAGIASARAAGCRVLGVTTTHGADRLGEAHELYASTTAALRAAFGKRGMG